MSDWKDLIEGVIAAVVGTSLSAIGARLVTRRKPVSATEVEDIADRVRSEREGRAAAVAEVLASEAIAANPDPAHVRQVLQNVITQIASTDTDRVSKPVEQLVNNYHEQALNQARVQFWFSVIAATIGFCWILYTGASIQPEKWVTASKTFPGVVMDAVAFLFFKQAAETRQRATELYDRLRGDKKLSEASAIVASIEDARLRGAVKAQLALHMSGLEPKEIDFSAFLTAEGPQSKPSKSTHAAQPRSKE